MNQKELLKHILQCVDTGIIPDVLLPFYDQTGVWRGDSITWRIPTPKQKVHAMRSIRLPRGRRITSGKTGEVLLTSYWASTDHSATLPYSEIQGSLVIAEDSELEAPYLHMVGGHFEICSDRTVHVPNLETVGGDFEAMQGNSVYAPYLRKVQGGMMVRGQIPPNIKTVGRRLTIYSVDEVEMRQLSHVGGYVSAYDTTSFSAPLLTHVGGHLLLHEARYVNLPSLESVGCDFLTPAATILRARSLRRVGGDYDTRSALGYYHPAIRVGGDWTLCAGALDAWVLSEEAKDRLRHRHDDPEI